MRFSLLIGGYTESLPHTSGGSEGIEASTLLEGSLAAPTLAARLSNPTWIIADSAGTSVFAVEENLDPGSGSIVRLARDPESGALRLAERVASGGSGPAHLAKSPDERWLVTANYGSGDIALHELGPTGHLSLADVVHRVGSGPDGVRQKSAHPHQVVFDPLTGIVAVPDLGTDSVSFYRIEGSALVEEADHRVDLPAGSGPRHIAFSPDGIHAFLLSELDASVTVLQRRHGAFVPITKTSLLVDAIDEPAGAEILVTADGACVMASNRGRNPTVSIFDFDARTGHLNQVERIGAPATPRAMALLDDAGYLLVAGQDSHEVVCYLIDCATRRLTVCDTISTRSPACICVL